MIWHTVVQHAVHIKKHGFRVEFPKAVFFHIFKNNFLHQPLCFNVKCLMLNVKLSNGAISLPSINGASPNLTFNT
jgi:hypothetical protein